MQDIKQLLLQKVQTCDNFMIWATCLAFLVSCRSANSLYQPKDNMMTPHTCQLLMSALTTKTSLLCCKSKSNNQNTSFLSRGEHLLRKDRKKYLPYKRNCLVFGTTGGHLGPCLCFRMAECSLDTCLVQPLMVYLQSCT